MVDRIEGLHEASARAWRCKEGGADRIGTPLPLVNPGCRSNLGYPGRQYVLRVQRDGPSDKPRAGRPGLSALPAANHRRWSFRTSTASDGADIRSPAAGSWAGPRLDAAAVQGRSRSVSGRSDGTDRAYRESRPGIGRWESKPARTSRAPVGHPVFFRLSASQAAVWRADARCWAAVGELRGVWFKRASNSAIFANRRRMMTCASAG